MMTDYSSKRISQLSNNRYFVTYLINSIEHVYGECLITKPVSVPAVVI